MFEQVRGIHIAVAVRIQHPLDQAHLLGRAAFGVLLLALDQAGEGLRTERFLALLLAQRPQRAPAPSGLEALREIAARSVGSAAPTAVSVRFWSAPICFMPPEPSC